MHNAQSSCNPDTVLCIQLKYIHTQTNKQSPCNSSHWQEIYNVLSNMKKKQQQQQQQESKISQEQTILFGGTLHSAFDSIHSKLHETVRSQVSTLPIIQSSLSSDPAAEESCDEKIYKKISRVYAKHLDVAQLYAEKEIFCLDKEFKKTKREKIVHLFLEMYQNYKDKGSFKLTENHSAKDHEEENGRESQDDTSTPPQQQDDGQNVILRYKIPLSKEEIPSAEEFSSLREEIKCLRQDLRNFIVEKHGYYQQLQALEHAKDSSAQVNESISNSIGMVKGQDDGDNHDEQTLNLVKRAMDGQKDLKEYIHHGKDLIKEMDRLTQEKDSSNETLEFSEVMKAKALEVAQGAVATGDDTSGGQKQHKRTLEEDYKERKERIKIVKGDMLKLFKK